jgi:anti-sigma-K factor RskA
VNDEPGPISFESRLPDDRAYWDDLTDRIVAEAEPILRQHREREAWWQPLAKWSSLIGVTAAAAALLVAVLGPPENPTSSPVSFEQLLAPEDPVGQAVVAGAAASEISAILLVESGGER